jgi:excisionase family DNA binding protein
MPTSRKLLNLKEVSAILNMNTEVLRRWLRNGKLPGVKVGSDWRVNAADLESFVNPAGNKNAASKNESPKKMCFRFPKWLEFSGLPRLLNDKIGPEAWPVFKKLIELDFELGKPSDRHVILDRVELSERTGYDEQVIEAVMALLEQNGLIRLTSRQSGEYFIIVTPIRTPRLILDISYEHGGVKGAPSKALDNSCLRRFLEPGDLT